MKQPVEQGHVGPCSWCQVDVGLAGGWRLARVDDDEPGRAWALAPVEDAPPEDGPRLGQVVADEEEAVGHVEVGEGPRLAVGAERLAEGLCGRCRAEAGAAVEVAGAQPGMSDDAQRVVLLEEELPRVVEGDDIARVAVAHRTAFTDDPTHRFRPGGLAQFAAVSHQGAREAVGAVVGGPAVQALGPEPAVVDAVHAAPPDADDLATLDANVQRAADRAEDAARLHPAVGSLLDALVHAQRPSALAGVWGGWPPRVADAVSVFVKHTISLLRNGMQRTGQGAGGAPIAPLLPAPSPLARDASRWTRP